VIQVNGGSLYVKDRNGADVFKVSCSIKGSGYKQQIVLTVDAVPAVQDCVFKDLSELSQNLNYEGHTATLSWSDDEAIQNTKYIVEYRYVTTDADGNVEVGNSIEIETLERTVSVSLAANQQLEWCVRQSLADRVNVGEWNSFHNILTDLKAEQGSNGAILSWNDAAKGSGTKYLLAYKTITYDSKGEAVYSNLITKVVSDSQYTVEGFSARNVEWKVGRVIDGTSDTVQEWSAYNSFDVIDPVLNAKFNMSETGDSSVAFLEWDTPVTATAGVQKYVIQYFQAQAKYSEEEASAMMDNGEVSYAQVECTNTRFVVSGLNNTEHTYWRIKAVDNVGNETDWTLGKSFRNDTYDTESPYFPAAKPVSIEYAWTANEKGGKNFGVNFSWTQAADASSGIYAYVLRYRKSSSTEESDWKEITTTVKEAEALKYSLNLDLDNENYSWEFYAADWVGNKSEALKGSFLTDTLAPVISGGLTLSTPYSFEDKAMYVQLGWNAAKDQSGSDDNASGVAYYEISISGKNTAGQDVVVTEKLNDPS